MVHNYDLAFSFISALTGNDPARVVCDFRMVHDKDKGVPGHALRGFLPELWSTICAYNTAGYGAFVCVNELDGNGRELHNVRSIRGHFIDLDEPETSAQSYQQAVAWNPAPSFAVNSSPGKVHIYWPSTPYADGVRFSTIQRKLISLFRSDKRIFDATRIMRLPGTFHTKGDPVLVTCHSLPGYGNFYPPEVLEAALINVQVIETGAGRKDLGDVSLAAPNAELAVMALSDVNPNNLDRAEWITVTSAFKQSCWTLLPEQEIFRLWSDWCAQYEHNDVAENLKQYNSIRNTEVGWGNLSRRSVRVMAIMKLGDPSKRAFANPAPLVVQPAPAVPNSPSVPPGSEFLTAPEQAEYFKGCFFVERFGAILVPSKRLLNQTQFKGRYGGKLFVIDQNGKTTDDPWKAALSSTLWNVPKVDHIRFVPQRAPFDLIVDDLGRFGVNTYSPAIIHSTPGDPTPFLQHLAMIIPNPEDQRIYIEYLAHNARFPGYKIPWAPLIQSEEGAGKGSIKRIIKHVMGGTYVYFPNAKDLAESGAKFNKWMREKLFILVDEIRVDDRRDLIEVLKPMISEEEIEVQGKGQDQDKEDNPANWAFFSNFKDAIPIRENGRRFAIFYSAIQSVRDLQVRGMDGDYFNRLYYWLDFGGGKEIVAHYLLNYPIERGAIPMRAPITSSTREALEQSRGPLDQLLHELTEDNAPGFRNGWASTMAFMNAARKAGINVRSGVTVAKVFEQAGFKKIGRAPREFIPEGLGSKTTCYSRNDNVHVEWFGRHQGYE